MGRRLCEDCGIAPWQNCVCGGEDHIAKILATPGYFTPRLDALAHPKDGAPEGPMLPPNHDVDEPF